MPVTCAGEDASVCVHLNLIGHAEGGRIDVVQVRLDVSRDEFRKQKIIGVEIADELAPSLIQNRQAIDKVAMVGVLAEQPENASLRLPQRVPYDGQGSVAGRAIQNDALDIRIILRIDRTNAFFNEVAVVVVDDDDRHQRRMGDMRCFARELR